jgi:hypothetical protein
LTKEVLGPIGLTKEDLKRLVKEDSPEQQAARSAAVDRLREVRKGLTLGPGITVRDLIDEGRRL